MCISKSVFSRLHINALPYALNENQHLILLKISKILVKFRKKKVVFITRRLKMKIFKNLNLFLTVFDSNGYTKTDETASGAVLLAQELRFWYAGLLW